MSVLCRTFDGNLYNISTKNSTRTQRTRTQHTGTSPWDRDIAYSPSFLLRSLRLVWYSRVCRTADAPVDSTAPPHPVCSHSCLPAQITNAIFNWRKLSFLDVSKSTRQWLQLKQTRYNPPKHTVAADVARALTRHVWIILDKYHSLICGIKKSRLKIKITSVYPRAWQTTLT